MAPEKKRTSGSVANSMVFSTLINNQSLPGHNLSVGLRAEAEDLGLSVDPHSLVAPPKGGPAD